MSDTPAEPEAPSAKSRPRVRYKCGCAIPVDALESGWCAGCASKKRKERFKKLQTRPGAAFPVHVKLPDGTTKALAWYHGRVTGTMKVPGVSEAFRSSAASERECLHALHQMYVQFLNRRQFQPPKPT